MCGHFCIGFIDFMSKGKSVLDYTNLFFPPEYENNYKIILKYFQQIKRLKWKIYCVICGKYNKFEKSEISFIFEKTLILPITCRKCGNEDGKIFKEDESIEILKILGLCKNI